jgi:hypothetical protein
MLDGASVKIAVGDEVRVHFHPPGQMTSFVEGVVSRVDVALPQGRLFVVDVTHEVILDREHPIQSGFQDYVRYECQDDFPGRIEILSTTKHDVMMEPTPCLMADESPVEISAEAPSDADGARFQVEVERQEVHRRGGLIAALFGRQR